MSWLNSIQSGLNTVSNYTNTASNLVSDLQTISNGGSVANNSAVNNYSSTSPTSTNTSGSSNTSSLSPPSSSGLDFSKIKDPDQRALMELQQELQKQNQMVMMLTNMQQVQHESRKAITQNFRV